VPGSGVNARGVALVEEATDPVVPLGDDTAPQRHEDSNSQSTKAAADEERRRSFAHRIRSRKVLVPLACVAAFLVGFGSVTALIRLGDRSTQSDTKPVPTTAAPVAPPSVPAPVVTTTPNPAASMPAAENAPPPAPAPAPTAATSESSVPPASAAPNTNPAGKAPPGKNK
jgi:cytoskeletal protein RodZ